MCTICSISLHDSNGDLVPGTLQNLLNKGLVVLVMIVHQVIRKQLERPIILAT